MRNTIYDTMSLIRQALRMMLYISTLGLFVVILYIHICMCERERVDLKYLVLKILYLCLILETLTKYIFQDEIIKERV